MPVSLACAREGLAFVSDASRGEAEHSKSSEGGEGTIHTNAELALRCSATQVHVMRREMEDARGRLSEMVTLARKSKTMKTWAPWLLMLEGFLLQASNEGEAARRYFEAVATLCGRDADTFDKLFQATSSTAYDLQNDELAVAAQTATIVLDAGLNKADIEAVKALVERTKRVQCSPHIHAVLKMVEGILSKGTITRSKHLLTQSLTLSSKSQDNYIRAFLFALLHEVFSHSHEDQALQMIQTGYAISRKMGKVDASTGKSFGMPFLNLIYSQALESHYKRSNITAELPKQESYSRFYRKCCESIDRNGYEKSIQLTQ